MKCNICIGIRENESHGETKDQNRKYSLSYDKYMIVHMYNIE